MKFRGSRAGIVMACLAGVLLVASCCAHRCGSSGGASVKSKALTVGAALTVKEPIVIADLVADPQKYVGQTVRLEGTVAQVCQGRGCWAEVQATDGSTFLARSLDETVLLPKDCAGRKIVVQGVVTELPAKAAAEPNPEGHACPRPQYLVDMKGAELR